MPLEESNLAANDHILSMKGKAVIQSAFDVEYTCVIEHMADVFAPPEAPMNIFRMDFCYNWWIYSSEKPNANFNGLPQQMC